ncbi:MAG: glycosyltransferase [Chloroflexi bacterium]|nr:glycosyltransferase [Chloroflexota bacterium]
MAGAKPGRTGAGRRDSQIRPLYLHAGGNKITTDTAYRKTPSVKLPDYEPIVGKNVIDDLRLLAKRLSGRVIQNINSTFSGGGVAEILQRMVPLLTELGVDARWSVIKGDMPFFEVTKKIHNTLHGRPDPFTQQDISIFNETSRKNIEEHNLVGDIIFVHDPQPVALVERKKELGKKWIWRCHIDVSKPNEEVWSFLQPWVLQYDASVFSAPAFSRSLPIRQFLISPSIDPLSDKNRELSRDTVDAVLAKYKIPGDKPIILQVSRFDYLKDPVGVIQAFRQVKRSIACRLVLAGGTATDDPESDKVLAEVMERAGNDPDIHVLLIPPGSDIEINALQRAAAIVLQKSLKEGFALTVSEALWKEKAVVASAVGGIPLQVQNKFTGLLSHGIEGTAYAIRQLLGNPEYARWLGKNGKEHVKNNFLITRHLKEYMLLFLALDRPEDVIYL